MSEHRAALHCHIAFNDSRRGGFVSATDVVTRAIAENGGAPFGVARDVHWHLTLTMTILPCLTSSRTARLAALATNRRHVRSIATHGNATLAARLARFIGRPLVRGALLVCRSATTTRDFLLTIGIH